jgi:hypothetical protein
MPLSHNEATNALRDIDKIERRSATAYAYSAASPFFILWGVLWAIGYGVSDLWPAYGGETWLGVDAFGIVASIYLGIRGKKREAGLGLRYGATALAIFVFIAGTFAIMGPVKGQMIGAFIPLLLGLFYLLIGIWNSGWRFIITGTVLMTLTLGGFFYMQEHFMLWMAIVGGGALVLAGLWLRQT